jgi:hypothetical protein
MTFTTEAQRHRGKPVKDSPPANCTGRSGHHNERDITLSRFLCASVPLWFINV